MFPDFMWRRALLKPRAPQNPRKKPQVQILFSFFQRGAYVCLKTLPHFVFLWAGACNYLSTSLLRVLNKVSIIDRSWILGNSRSSVRKCCSIIDVFIFSIIRGFLLGRQRGKARFIKSAKLRQSAQCTEMIRSHIDQFTLTGCDYSTDGEEYNNRQKAYTSACLGTAQYLVENDCLLISRRTYDWRITTHGIVKQRRLTAYRSSGPNICENQKSWIPVSVVLINRDARHTYAFVPFIKIVLTQRIYAWEVKLLKENESVVCSGNITGKLG